MGTIRLLQQLVLPGVFACGAALSAAQTPGTEDSSFSTGALGTGTRPFGLGIATQPDEKILMPGPRPSGTSTFSVMRLHPNGARDTSFGSDGIATAPVLADYPASASRASVDPFGRIYLFGGYSAIETAPNSFRTRQGIALVRFLPNGLVDSSFGNGGAITHQSWNDTGDPNPPATQTIGIAGVLEVFNFALLPDGRVMLVGTSASSTTALAFARFDANGQPDTSFGSGGVRTVELGESMQPKVSKAMRDGAVVVLGGIVNSRDHLVVKISPQGLLDTSFGTAGKVALRENAAYQYELNELEVQPDDRILVAGQRTPVAGSEGLPFGNPSDSLVARLTANGALDSSFGTGGVRIFALAQDWDSIEALTLEPGGKILAAGTLSSIDANNSTLWRPFLLRLLADGQLDGTFENHAFEGTEDRTADLAVGQGHAFLLTTASSGYRLRKFFVDPLPRSGSATNDQSAAASSFAMAAFDARGLGVANVTTTQQLGLHGYIYPQALDIGATAQLFVVAQTANGFYMRNTSGDFVPWNGNLSALVPAYEGVQLGEVTHLPIYAGALPFAGAYRLYIGYNQDGGTLIYSAQPTLVTVQ